MTLLYVIAPFTLYPVHMTNQLYLDWIYNIFTTILLCDSQGFVLHLFLWTNVNRQFDVELSSLSFLHVLTENVL